ncbi:MAG: glycosyltransferase family 39 protein [Hyphomicrobiaceae bacterium]
MQDSVVAPVQVATDGGGARHDLGLAVAGLLALHVVTWTVYGTWALGVGLIHDDMIEAWNWGQAPQFGYYKHPPLFAWMTWAWFRVFPIADWSFYLFSAVNSAVGLAGVGALARYFGLARYRVAAISLLMLTPLYGFLALKYNANAVLIPIWPWAAYFLLKSLETRTVRDGAILGLLGGLALLGKYYSVLLAIAFLAATLVSQQRRAYYRSPAPYVAIGVALIVIAPHVVWTVANGFPTVEYALSKFNYPLRQIAYWAFMTALAPIIFLGLPFVVCAVAGEGFKAALASVRQWLLSPRNRTLVIVAAAPFAMTLGFGFVGHAKVSLSYTIPIFFMGSLVLLAACSERAMERTGKWALRLAVAFCLGVMVLAPVIGYGRMRAQQDAAVAPIKELASEARRIWMQQTGRPLAVVASTDRFIGAVSFYGTDHPLYFVNFNQRQAPWMTDARLLAGGFVAICRADVVQCRTATAAAVPQGSKRIPVNLQHVSFGRTGPKVAYLLTLVPPGQWKPVPMGPLVERAVGRGHRSRAGQPTQ